MSPADRQGGAAAEALKAAARAEVQSARAEAKVDQHIAHTGEALRALSSQLATLRAENTAQHREGREMLNASFARVYDQIDEAEEANRQRGRDLWAALGGVRSLLWATVWSLGGGAILLLLGVVGWLLVYGPPWRPL